MWDRSSIGQTQGLFGKPLFMVRLSSMARRMGFLFVWLSLGALDDHFTQAQDEGEPPQGLLEPPKVVVNRGAIFDRWMCLEMSEIQTRELFEKQLSLELNKAHAACVLTQTQIKKLELAAYGDIKRYFEQLQSLRQMYLSSGAVLRLQGMGFVLDPRDHTASILTLSQQTQLAQLVCITFPAYNGVDFSPEELRQKLDTGPFCPGSIFAKVLLQIELSSQTMTWNLVPSVSKRNPE